MAGNQQPIYNIVKPHRHDVLSGRGNSANRHPGNEHFRSLVKGYKEDYVACPKSNKSLYSKLIYDEIRSMDPPGRFLKQDPVTKVWSDIGRKAALAKTRQALRDGAPELLMDLQTVEHCRNTLAHDISPASSVPHTSAETSNPVNVEISSYLPRIASSESLGTESLLSLDSMNRGKKDTFQFTGSLPTQAGICFGGLPPYVTTSSTLSQPVEQTGLQANQFVSQIQTTFHQPDEWQKLCNIQEQLNTMQSVLENALKQTALQAPNSLQFQGTFNQANTDPNNWHNFARPRTHRVSIDHSSKTIENAPYVPPNHHQQCDDTSNALLAMLASLNSCTPNKNNYNVNNTKDEGSCAHSSLMEQLQTQQAYRQMLPQLGISQNSAFEMGDSPADAFFQHSRAKSA